MFWIRLSRFDRGLIIGSSVALILAIGLIFNDQWIFQWVGSDVEHLDQIGQVRSSAGDVRRRHRTALSWMPLAKQDVVYQGDSVFTGSESEAVITTDRGEQISISPKSLVVINTKSDGIRLDINYGSVLGKLSQNQKLVIASGGEVTEFSGSDALLKIDVESGKEVMVNVIKGEVEVLADSGTKKIGPDDQATLSGQGLLDPRDMKIELMSPVPERVFKPDERDDLILSWSSNLPSATYLVEVATDLDFSKIIFSEDSPRTVVKPHSLPTNKKLYWRVSGSWKLGEPRIYSPKGSFVLNEDVPPDLIFPTNGMNLAFEKQNYPLGDSIDLILRWRPQAPSQDWDVQVARQSDFRQPAISDRVERTHFVFSNVSPGTYYWRVRPADWSTAMWSEPSRFTIQERRPTNFAPPKAVITKTDFLMETRPELSPMDLPKGAEEDMSPFVTSLPKLSWAPLQGAITYEVQVASRSDFSTLIAKDEVPDTHFTWSSVRPGSFYWRVRSVTASGTKGPFTPPQPLKVRLAPPHSLTREVNLEEVENLSLMDSAPPPFAIVWSPTLYTAKYLFEFAKDETFSKPLRLSLTKPFKRVQVPVAGTYYWRVRSLNEKNDGLSDWSPPRKYVYKKKYLSPETTKELRALHPNNDTIMLIGTGSLKVHFRWASPLAETTYRFQLATEDTFKEPILNLKTDKRQYLHESELADGWYFWRIRIESKKFTSPWTTAYKFQIKNEEEKFDFKISEKKAQEKLESYLDQRKELASQQKIAASATKVDLPQLVAPKGLSAPSQLTIDTIPAVYAVSSKWRTMPDQKLSSYVRNPPLLEWTPVEKAISYQVEIFSDPEFQRRIDLMTTRLSTLSWQGVRPGTYYWRVRALNQNFEPSSYTAGEPFTILASTPRLSAPIAQQAGQSGGVFAASLSWAPTLFARKYLLEWSLQADMARSESRVVASEEAPLEVATEATRYWRVTALNANEKPLGPPSPIRALNVSIQRRMPAAGEPLSLLYPPHEATLVHVEETSPKVQFMWNAPGADQFQIEVARDESFKDVILKVKTSKTSTTLNLPAAEKTLYWRAKALINGAKKQKRLVTSNPYRLTIDRRMANESASKK